MLRFQVPTNVMDWLNFFFLHPGELTELTSFSANCSRASYLYHLGLLRDKQLYIWLVFLLGIYAYATLKDDATISAEDLRKELKAIVREKIGSFAVPEVIQVILL